MRERVEAGTSGSTARVLLLAYYFLSCADSGAARPRRFARYLTLDGTPTDVITNGAGPTSFSGVPVHLPADSASARTHYASGAAAWVERRLLPYNERLPWVPYAVAEGVRLLGSERFHAIVSTSPPLATHFAALELKRRFGIRWIADFRDPVSDNPFRNRRIGWPWDVFWERVFFRYADAVIANTDTVADVWRRRYPQWAHKIHLIWNGYDPDDRLEPAPIPPRSRKIMCHVGSLYGGRRPTQLLASVERLIRNGRLDPARICVQLTGPHDGVALDTTRAPYETLSKHGCIEATGRSVPAEAARQSMQTADVLLLLDVNEKGQALQVPAKLFEYIRIGRPVLAFTPQNSPAQRILAGSGIPARCVAPDDSEEATDGAVLECWSLPNTPVVANLWFWDTFDARRQAQTLNQILDGR